MQIAPPPPPTSSLRLAICVTGQIRAGTCTSKVMSPLESLRAHLVAPLRERGAHVDVFAVLDLPPMPNRSGPLLRRALDTLAPVQHALHDEASDWRAWLRARRRPFGPRWPLNVPSGSACGALRARFETVLMGNSVDGGAPPPKEKQVVNHFHQARKLQACWRMVSEHEATLPTPYTHVVRTRPDLRFPRSFELLPYLTAPTNLPKLADARPTPVELCVQPLRDRAKRQAGSPIRSPRPTHCYAPCSGSHGGSQSVDGVPHALPAIVQPAASSNTLPSFYVHDHFYAARRHVAHSPRITPNTPPLECAAENLSPPLVCTGLVARAYPQLLVCTRHRDCH
jgi:hypothetical protein